MSDRKSDAAGPRPPTGTRSEYARTIAFANGCSLSASTAAANSSTSSSDSVSTVTIPVTAGSPLVNVPVLSNRTTSIVRIRSSANRFFTSTPAFAARSVEIAITSGMASPRACGQAITRTVTVRVTASSSLPSTAHTTNVIRPAIEAK